jgi:hypothetical protein
MGKRYVPPEYDEDGAIVKYGYYEDDGEPEESPGQLINPREVDNATIPAFDYSPTPPSASPDFAGGESQDHDFTKEEADALWKAGAWDQVKNLGKQALDLFKDKNGAYDLKKLMALGGGLLAASKPNNAAPTGYQGKIPNYTAERQMLTAPPADSRSGAYGIDYGGDVTYKDEAGKLIGKQARGINDLREMALMDQQSSYGPIQRMVTDRAAYWDTKPVGSDFGVAGGTLSRTGGDTATFTDADGKTYQMNRGESFADTAANIPAFAKAWQENYGYKAQDGGIRGLLQPASTSSKELVGSAMSAALPPKEDGSGPDMSKVIMGMAKGGIADGLKPEGFVVPADVVSHFGNGSSEAGLKLLASRLGAEPIKGEGDGMSDSIPTTIGGRQEARVANDEAFISPEMVKRIGGGDAKKGAQKLYAMMDRVREERTGTKEQGKQIDPEKFMPGGSVQRYAPGGTTDPKIPTGVTGSESSLSNWAGDYVTGLIGRGSALAKTPYQA